jgi:arylformamidase
MDERVTTGEASGRRRLVELSHVIRDGLVTYPGLPAPDITPHLTRVASRAVYAAGTEFAMHRISMIGNTGTYLDSPYHRYPAGADLAGLPLEILADLPILIVRVESSVRAAGPAELAAAARSEEFRGAAVLLHTGWDRHFGTQAYGEDAPYLTEAGADWLVEAEAALVGIDSVNIDNAVPGGTRPAHSALLAAGIPILEHLTNLAALPLFGARLHAAPPRVEGFGTFPVRAYALV